MGTCIWGVQCHARLLVLGEGGGGEGEKILKCYTFDLIYFIKQYRDPCVFLPYLA